MQTQRGGAQPDHDQSADAESTQSAATVLVHVFRICAGIFEQHYYSMISV